MCRCAKRCKVESAECGKYVVVVVICTKQSVAVRNVVNLHFYYSSEQIEASQKSE